MAKIKSALNREILFTQNSKFWNKYNARTKIFVLFY